MMNSKIGIKNAVLINGIGTPPLRDAKILIDGNRIVEIGEDLKFPKESKIIDVDGKTVMPGLMDIHIHLAFDALRRSERLLVWSLTTPPMTKVLHALKNAQHCLEAGFTTLRCMTHADQSNYPGNWGPIVRDAIKRGLFSGSRMLVCGMNLLPNPPRQPYGFFEGLEASMYYGTMPGERIVGPGPYPPGPWGIRMAVREIILKGADFIKFYVTGMSGAAGSKPNQTIRTLEEIQALTDQAHRQGIRTACHAHATPGIKAAIIGGTDTIEHGTNLDEECVKLMKERGTYLVPTLSISYRIMTRKDIMRKVGVPEVILERSEAKWEDRIKSLQMAHKAGIKICCATDGTMMPVLWPGENALELELLVKFGGLSPMEAIVAATKTNSEAIGRKKDLGTIETGKLADLIVVEGDPLKDIKLLQKLENIKIVMKGGEIMVNRGI